MVHCLSRERNAERLDARKVQLRGGVQLGDELVEADYSVGDGLGTQGHVYGAGKGKMENEVSGHADTRATTAAVGGFGARNF